ncbi:hypothetical protein B296_00057931 [Ensete ventricosum]|uniref:Uncharacterized protein n=1 Tax=Ensete ventricosum TaxID=4639 RepID=A0A426XPA6_ENSVE|nr:hypothetical protein B296_00057931 [Ensete ventricosum]
MCHVTWPQGRQDPLVLRHLIEHLAWYTQLEGGSTISVPLLLLPKPISLTSLIFVFLKSYHSVPAWWRTILKLNATWPGPRSPGCIKLMGGGAQQGSAAPPTAVDVAKCFEERWGSRESEQRVDWSVFRPNDSDRRAAATSVYPVNAVR